MSSRQDAADDALVAVTAGHLVARLQLALHRDEHLDHLEHARRQLVAALQLLDAIVELVGDDASTASSYWALTASRSLWRLSSATANFHHSWRSTLVEQVGVDRRRPSSGPSGAAVATGRAAFPSGATRWRG
jgi:hypothetical protein